MRLILASPFVPHSGATHGGAIYLFALASALARHCELHLVSFATGSERSAVLQLPDGLAGVALVPRAERFESAPLRRVAGTLSNAARWVGTGLPLLVLKFRSRAMRTALSVAVRDSRPDAVLLEMALMAQYAEDLCNTATVLTDHEAATPTPARLLPFGLGRARDRAAWERYVRAAYAVPTAVQALNEDDAAALSARLGRPVAVRRPIVPIPARVAQPARAGERLLFLGDWSHHPNPEAAEFLVRKVLPLVRARVPGARLVLAGPRATPAVEALGTTAGVEFVGFVPALDELMGSVRALVAPLLSGDGSRIKVLTALAHGVPVVGNARALRGVDAGPPAVRRGEDPGALAEACVELLRDAGAAAAAGAAARSWAESKLSADAVALEQIEFVRRITATAGKRSVRP